MSCLIRLCISDAFEKLSIVIWFSLMSKNAFAASSFSLYHLDPLFVFLCLSWSASPFTL